MEASAQPVSFRSALASVFSDVYQIPSCLESRIHSDSKAGEADGSAAGPDDQHKQEQDQPIAPGGVHADPYAIRVAEIKQKFDADAAAAVEQQQQLEQAAQHAKQRELGALAAADATYTPAWRHAGLPAKASQLAADLTWLAGVQLLNPAAILQQQKALQHKEVLLPPAVFAYCDKEADPHYLTGTSNQKVRQVIASERIAAVKLQKMQVKQWGNQQQQQQQTTTAASRSTANHQSVNSALGSTTVGFQATHKSVPWYQLKPEEVSQKVAASTARHKAMVGIMTPAQRESEERIIKTMYHKLSFLRNPRYPMSRAAAAVLQNGLQGSSPLRMQQHKQQRSTTSRDRSKSPGSSSYRGKAGALAATAMRLNSSFMSPVDVGFCVVPAAGVLFDAYEPGGVYFQTVQLQNVGNVINSLRLLPPTSRYFQVSLPRYPGAANELAPGMAATVSVCFTPDTLGDYSDAFVVETVQGRFEVSLMGSRPHPHLTLGKQLQAGDVLVGNSRSRTVDFFNKGGAGRFLVLSAADWAAAQATDVDIQQQQEPMSVKRHTSSHGAAAAVAVALSPRAGNSSLAGSAPDGKAAAVAVAAQEPETAQAAPVEAMSGVFMVTPTFLNLPPGASGRLTVNFSPDRPGQHTGEFVLICDNCTVRPLKIVGRGSDVDVRLVALDGRQLQDQDKQASVWFGQVNPGCSCFRTVKVQNLTPLLFPYKWQVDHLQLPGSAKTASTLAGQRNPQQMLDTGAAVALAAGSAAGAAAAAAACLSPFCAEVVSASGAAHTSLSIQADCMTASTQEPAASATSAGSSSSSWEMQSALCHTEQQQLQEQGDESVQQHAEFSVHPSSGVLAPGEVAEFTVEFTPSIVAEHAASAQLLVERSGDTLMTAMRSAGGRSGRGSTASCSSSTSAAAPSGSQFGKVCESCTHIADSAAAAVAGIESDWESVIALAFEGLGAPVCIGVEPSAVVRLPGQLTVGDAGQQVLTLRNKSAAAVHFSFNSPNSTKDKAVVDSKEHSSLRVASAAVSVEPASGMVPSYGAISVTVKFTGLRAGTHTENLLCRVAHGAAIPVVAKASIVDPVVTAAVPQLDFGVICIGSSHTQQLKLHNTAANCSTDWQLMQLDQEQPCPHMQLQLQPSSGSLGPAAEGSVAVTVTGSCTGSHKMLLRLTSNSRGSSGSRVGSNSSMGNRSSSGGSGGSSSGSCQQTSFVQVIVTVAEPCLVLDTYKICLKPTYLGVQQQRSITITNTSRLPLQFSWTVQQLQLQQQRQWHLNGSSSSSPGSKRTTSSNSGSIDTTVCGQQGSLSTPQGNSANEKSACEVPLWQRSGQLGLSMLPATGHLNPQQSLQVQLLLEPTQVGPVKLLCCCMVPNMSQLAGFVLTAIIEGLQVAYEVERPLSEGWRSGMVTATMVQGNSPGQQFLISDGNRGLKTGAAAGAAAAGAAAPLLADFGVVALHQVSWLRLRVTNLTSIDTSVRAWVSRYPAVAAAATAATAAAAAVCSPDIHHLGQRQQQQLGVSAPGAQLKPSSQSGQRISSHWGQLGTSQSGQLANSSGHAYGLPVSTLPASLAPAQQQHQATVAVAQSNSRSSPSSPQQTFSPQQRQQQPSIAARLAAAVSGYSPTGPLNLQASSTPSSVASPVRDSGGGGGAMKRAGAEHVPGPFRSAAGNSMMAARRVAAAAAEALGAGRRGCAVCIEPYNSNLPGWATVDLQLTAFNNLPGTYVDFISVQVGDLPVRHIPLRLSVVGSPLVISRERVLLQGLQTLLALQNSAVALDATAAAATAAAVTSRSMLSSGAASASAGNPIQCSPVSRTCSSSSSSSIVENVAGATTVQLRLGKVPVGVQHERTFYVVNTGALPMQLSWQYSVPADSTAGEAAGVAVSDKQLAAVDAVAGGSSGERISFLPVNGAADTDYADGLAAGPGSCAGLQDASATALHSKAGLEATAAVALGAEDRSKAASSTAGGRVSTARGTAAAATAAAAKSHSGPGTAKAAVTTVTGGVKQTSGSGAAGKQQSAGENEAAAGAAAPGVQQQQHQDQQQQQQQEGDALASRRTTNANAGQHHHTSDAAQAAAMIAGESARAVPEYEQLLPSGGPSGLLKTLQAMAQHRKQQQQGGLSSAAADTAAATAAVTAANNAINLHKNLLTMVVDSAHMLEAFSVNPQTCVVHARQQQKFTVSFCSWHSGVHTVKLVGQQLFAAAEALSDDQMAADSNGNTCELTVMFWPRQQEQRGTNIAVAAVNGSSASASAEAAAAAPVELILSGGFHAHAAPPLMPTPHLQVALSATAVDAQLTPSDPTCLVWLCCSVHDPSSHGSYKHTVTLSNTAGCPLIFQLETEGPFRLASAVPSVAQDANAFRGLKGTGALSSMLPSSSNSSASSQRLPTDTILLPPGESVDATLMFTPPPQPASADTPSRQQQQQSAQQQEQQQQLQQYSDTEYAGALLVKPTNGQPQRLPLSAMVTHPGLTASHARLDFGLVHPSAPRPMELLLTNPTRVDASWQATVLLQSAAAGGNSSSSRVFSITPDCGFIPGRGLGMPKTQRVIVTCAPIGNLAAAAELKLLVDKGGSCSVKLQAQGTFDETCEHLAILKDM